MISKARVVVKCFYESSRPEMGFVCTLLAMRSTDLTDAQARALAERLRSMLGYLSRLTKRMEQERFPNDDELLLSAREAYNAMHDLTVKAYYLGCKGQTG